MGSLLDVGQQLMNNKLKLNLRGDQYNEMIAKFKNREQQTSLEEALVYLKLRDLECDNSRALIFAKKKERCIDGTIERDGPPGFRKLDVLKPESKLTNGWLRGEKLKYAGATGYTDVLKKNQSAQKLSITKYHQKGRQFQEQLRKARSKSTVTIDLHRPRESLEKISAMKEEASKERENRNMFIEFGGLRLDQTTKNFFKQAENLDQDGLVVKLGAFSPLISDQSFNLKTDMAGLKGKSLASHQIQGSNKRKDILNYQQRLRDFTDGKIVAEEGRWKSLVHRKDNDQRELIFGKQTVQEASNPLILMSTKQLKRDLQQSQKRYCQNMTQYSNFHHSLEKAVKIEFLNNRKFSTIPSRNFRPSSEFS